MFVEKFQDSVKRTMATVAPITGSDAALVVLALGLAGESGEVVDHIKKYVAHGHDLDREELLKESGDVLFTSPH